MRLIKLGLFLLALALVATKLTRLYEDHGHGMSRTCIHALTSLFSTQHLYVLGNQTLVFFVVLSSFALPLLTPVLQLKNLMFVHLLPHSVEAYVVNTWGTSSEATSTMR